jgi:glycosyltransferase involved in cell wall biosynthesis
MHVLIIPSWYPKNPEDIGGSFFREQALALKRNGCKVGVIAPQLRSIRQWRSIFNGPRGMAHELDDGIPTYRWHGTAWLPRIPYANAKLWVSCGCKLFTQYVKENGMPDILHAHSLLNAGVLAREISLRYGIPFVVTEHSTAFSRNLVKNWQFGLAQEAAEKASSRIAVSEPFCNLLGNLFQGQGEKWLYIPNIVSSSFENEELKVKKLSDGLFSFCNVSFLDPKKGIDILLRAFAIAFKGRSGIQLVIGGEGPEKLTLENLASELGISSQIKFLGLLSRKEVVNLMKNSHAYVLSSHFETFGVVLVEALALGRPVIATKCGGPESIVTPQDGYLVPPNEVNLLAEAMRSMYEEYCSFDQQKIRERCLDRFSEKAVSSALKELYSYACSLSQFSDEIITNL